MPNLARVVATRRSAGHRHFQTGAQRITVNPGNDRHRQSPQAIARVVNQREVAFGADAIERRHLVDIGAANEGRLTGAGEHQCAQVVAPGQRPDFSDEIGHQGAIEGVKRFAVVERDIGDDTFGIRHEPDIDPERGGVGHGSARPVVNGVRVECLVGVTEFQRDRAALAERNRAVEA
jgi:hypothetical protein